MNYILGLGIEELEKRHKRVYHVVPICLVILVCYVLAFLFGCKRLLSHTDFSSFAFFSLFSSVLVIVFFTLMFKYCEGTRYRLYKLSNSNKVVTYHGYTISEMVLASNIEDLGLYDTDLRIIREKRSVFSRRYLKSLSSRDFGYTLSLFSKLTSVDLLKQLLLFSAYGVSSRSEPITVYTVVLNNKLHVLSVELERR